MTRIPLHKKAVSLKERSQVLVIVALSFVGIIAIIGLAMDVGLMFAADAKLQRSVDAAALAAALKYRRGAGPDLLNQLRSAAEEYVVLNGTVLDSSLEVHTCYDEPELCIDPTQGGVSIPRKLVIVKAVATVRLVFLPVIGINSVKISAQATGESASLDLVLVLDTSESMTDDAPVGDPLRDPSVCNDDVEVQRVADKLGWGATDPYTGEVLIDSMPGACHPFQEVKVAAKNFVSNLYFPYDRVAIVTFDKRAITWLNFDEDCNAAMFPGGDCDSTNPDVVANAIQITIINVIKQLDVYDAEKSACPAGQPCLPYCTQAIIDAGYCNDDYPDNFVARDDPNAVYAGNFDCGDGWHPGDDPHLCPTTDLADGMYYGGTAFRGSATSMSAIRNSSLWVLVLLTDGAANVGSFNDEDRTPTCPPSTWDPYAGPLCRDKSNLTRHCGVFDSYATCTSNGNGLDAPYFRNGVLDPVNYDADDAAHDAADYVGLTQKAVIFSIGLGKAVVDGNTTVTTEAQAKAVCAGDHCAGLKLLTYAAEKVGQGSFYFGSNSSKLDKIFKDIGDKIATRLAH